MNISAPLVSKYSILEEVGKLNGKAVSSTGLLLVLEFLQSDLLCQLMLIL